eukprot:gene11490-15323_t
MPRLADDVAGVPIPRRRDTDYLDVGTPSFLPTGAARLAPRRLGVTLFPPCPAQVPPPAARRAPAPAPSPAATSSPAPPPPPCGVVGAVPLVVSPRALKEGQRRLDDARAAARERDYRAARLLRCPGLRTTTRRCARRSSSAAAADTAA